MKFVKGLAMAGLAATCAVSFASCGGGSDADYTVGILQYVTHDALDKATDGFKTELKAKAEAEGKTIKFIEKNPQTDQTLMQTMATNLVRKCDLVLGNATPAATALQTAAATEGKKKLPILFTSVTDPAEAGLVKSNAEPGGQVTGTSDINPVDQQIDLIVDLKGNDCKIGFFYSIDEVNSKSQCDAAIEYIKENYTNVTYETKTISDQNQIGAQATTLCNNGVDAIYIPTDNRLASNMTAVANVTNEKKVPLICGESSMVDNGGTFTLSISYYELGVTTGEMAWDCMFNGKSPSTMAVQSQTDISKFEFVKNDTAISAMGITLTDEFKTKYNIQ